jgi:hypothetical protein
MNNGWKTIGRICRPYGARYFFGVRTTEIPLLTELGRSTNDTRLFYPSPGISYISR